MIGLCLETQVVTGGQRLQYGPKNKGNAIPLDVSNLFTLRHREKNIKNDLLT